MPDTTSASAPASTPTAKATTVATTLNNVNEDIMLVYSALSILYALGKDIEPALQAFYQLIFLKKPLTDAQREAMLNNHNALSAGLQRPVDG